MTIMRKVDNPAGEGILAATGGRTPPFVRPPFGMLKGGEDACAYLFS
jgi:hypothetical protein